MANDFIKPSVIASASLGLLQAELVLGRLVNTDFQREFQGTVGPNGDSVTVRVPALLGHRTSPVFRSDRSSATPGNANGPIQYDDLVERSLTVQLDTHVYNATRLTDENLTLDIADFGAQVLSVQMDGVARGVEQMVAAEIEGATYHHSVNWDSNDPWKSIIDARTELNKANVPLGDRVILLGADLEAELLKSDRLSKVDQSGDNSALRQAQVGVIAGMPVFVSNYIDPGKGYVFHRSAFTLVTRAPVVPQGAVSGATASFGGYAMRWVRDYDPEYLRDRSVVNTYAGTGHVLDSLNGDGGAPNTLQRAVELVVPSP